MLFECLFLFLNLFFFLPLFNRETLVCTDLSSQVQLLLLPPSPLTFLNNPSSRIYPFSSGTLANAVGIFKCATACLCLISLMIAVLIYLLGLDFNISRWWRHLVYVTDLKLSSSTSKDFFHSLPLNTIKRLLAFWGKITVHRGNYSGWDLIFLSSAWRSSIPVVFFFRYFCLAPRKSSKNNFSDNRKRTFRILNAQSLCEIKRRNTWDISKFYAQKRIIIYLCKIHLF